MQLPRPDGRHAAPTPQINDPVSHPEHYTYGKIECIDYLMAIGAGYDFCIGNVIKYVTRAKHKGTQLEDLQKARQYLEFAIKAVEEELK